MFHIKIKSQYLSQNTHYSREVIEQTKLEVYYNQMPNVDQYVNYLADQPRLSSLLFNFAGCAVMHVIRFHYCCRSDSVAIELLLHPHENHFKCVIIFW